MDPDAGVPAHFGAPVAEQRALDAGDAVVSLAHQGIVTVSGPDRLSWLNSMTSQRLLGLAVGEPAETLLLGPNGRIEHALRVVDDGERTWLLVDAGSAGPLTAYLQRMRFALRVDVEDVSERFAAVLAFDGGRAVPELRDLGVVIVEWRDPWSEVAPGGVQYAPAEHPGAGWRAIQLVVARADLARITARVHAGTIGVAGAMALDALEIRAARPTQQHDVDDRAIPHEFDWLRTAVHLNKGCYRGQETVAKVHNLGHPPRRLSLLHLDGSSGALPAAGARVFLAESLPTTEDPAASSSGPGATADARPVGRLTRSALHYEWGGIALALLKRSVPEDAELVVEMGEGETPVAAAQEVIVPADAGATRRADISARFGGRRN